MDQVLLLLEDANLAQCCCRTSVQLHLGIGHGFVVVVVGFVGGGFVVCEITRISCGNVRYHNIVDTHCPRLAKQHFSQLFSALSRTISTTFPWIFFSRGACCDFLLVYRCTCVGVALDNFIINRHFSLLFIYIYLFVLAHTLSLNRQLWLLLIFFLLLFYQLVFATTTIFYYSPIFFYFAVLLLYTTHNNNFRHFMQINQTHNFYSSSDSRTTFLLGFTV